LPQKVEQLAALEQKMAESSFWEDQQQAQQIIARANALKGWTEPAQRMQQSIHDLKDLLPDAVALGDEALLQEMAAQLAALDTELSELELRSMLSGEMDGLNCFLSINAGAGGTESCDWVAMLARMYERWASRRGWKVEEIDSIPGEVAGLKSITMKFTGPYAYGYAKAERGVHRLVRISPFDSNARRHTSFASVDISPEIADDIQVDIRPEDLRIDTFRASGAGGQHVNRTDSAVRITHLPSGIVVSSQSERSQLQNKETCFRMLRSKLYERQVEERDAQLRNISGEKKEIAWGSQIRSYVFQPYTLVKDNRTKVEIGNVQAVMDGEIDPFITAYLKEFGERPRESAHE
jgi:peptide chain release factor 2